MQIHRIVAIGSFVAVAVAGPALWVGAGARVLAATAIATTQPDAGTGRFSPMVERLPGRPGHGINGQRSGLAQQCIPRGQTCVVNGTPCCAGSTCQGKFPYTSCR
jgi:hypothetical protein